MNRNPNQPLTIVHTEASNAWGGQEIRILQEARWFRDHGHHVVLIAPQESIIFQRFTEDGFATVICSFEKRKQWLDAFRLAHQFRRMQPEVVATHSSVDSWAGLIGARLAGVPVKLRYRHVSAPVHPHLLNRVLYTRFADHVLTTAECIRQELITKLGVRSAKISTVPTGIQPPSFPSDREAARLRLCHEFQLPVSTRFIGCVAVLRNWKGQDFLMSAFDTIADKFPNHVLMLVGEGPGRPRLERDRCNLKSARRILLPGHQEDPWRFFRGFDLAVLPSYKDEGIPQSLLQAMFAECPVAGSRAGGIPEIVIDGETGLLAEPKSVPELAECISQTLSFPVETGGRIVKALHFVRSRHTYEQMGSNVQAIIEGVLHG